MLIDALAYLRDCDTHLGAARTAAEACRDNLTGGRQVRAGELVEKIYDAIHHSQRLSFVVTGDLRAEQNS